jgi:hypothetical protein
LLTLVDPLHEALKSSHKTYTDFITQLRLDDEESEKSKAINEEFMAFVENYEKIENASAGKEKNDAAVTMLKDIAEFTKNVEANK